MTIEATLERIAAALEAISRQNTAVLNEPIDVTPPKRGPGRPPKNPEAAAPAPVKQEDPFETEEEPAAALTIEDVRAALVDYQKRSGSAEKARGVLKQFGHCDTLKALKPENFAAVFSAAKTGA